MPGTARRRLRGNRDGRALALLIALVGALAVPAAPSGGSVAATGATDPTPVVVDGDRIVAVVDGPGSTVGAVSAQSFYRSEDAGLGWVAGGPLPPRGRIVFAEDAADVLLAGDRPRCGRGGDGAPLHRSVDGGASWQPVAGGDETLPLAVWAGAGLALATGCGDLRRSLDGGATWATLPVPEPGRDVTAFAVVPDTSSVGAATERAAVLAFTGEGGTSRLRRLDLSDPADPVFGDVLRTFWGVGALAAGGGRLLLGDATGVWVSDDGGATWGGGRAGLEEVTLSVDPLTAALPDAELARGFGIDAVGLDPAEPDRLYAGTVGGLFASVDGGGRWRRVAGVEGPVFDLVLAAESDRLFAQTMEGVVAVPLDA